MHRLMPLLSYIARTVLWRPTDQQTVLAERGGFTSTAFLTYCLSQCYVVTLSRCYDLYFIHCHPSSLDVILENRELAVTFHKSFTNPGARRSAARFEISRRAANVSSLSLSPVRILPFRGQQRQAEERLSARSASKQVCLGSRHTC
jgi:hypothetical protein